jgi:hypothetical protein
MAAWCAAVLLQSHPSASYTCPRLTGSGTLCARLEDPQLPQCLAGQFHAALCSRSQQRLGLRRVAWTAFAMEQHHREVVLTERMAALCGDSEVKPCLDMVAHEPSRPSLHEIWIGGRVGSSAGAERAPKEQAAEPLARHHVLTTGDGEVTIVSSPARSCRERHAKSER